MKILALCVMFALPIGAASGQCRVWERVFPANSPSARNQHAMAFDSRDDPSAGTVLFGGHDGNMWLGDTWVFDGSNWNLRATTGPSARYAHAMAYDSVRERVVLFGGSNSSGVPLGDTWEWDGVSWTLVATTGPLPRVSHAMAYDSRRGVTVLFGGFIPNVAISNETWEWDGASWTQVVVASPPEPRRHHAMAYDSSCRKVMTFGGQGVSGQLNDTWEYDGDQWAPSLPLSSPGPRIAHTMAYDSVRRKTILIGGVVGFFQPAIGTWEYDGADWKLVSSAPPSDRLVAAAVFDSRRGKTVHFGGWDLNVVGTNETWEWASVVAPVSITSQPTNQVVNSLQAAVFSVAATGHGTLTYQWRQNGANVFNGGGISGADSPMLTITAVTSANFGAYDCAVTNACGTVLSHPAALKVHCHGDADNNGIVDFADVTAVFGNWLFVCP